MKVKHLVWYAASVLIAWYVLKRVAAYYTRILAIDPSVEWVEEKGCRKRVVRRSDGAREQR